jgi:putative ABC transport system permease protein
MALKLLPLYLSEFKKRRKKTALITFAIAWGSLSILLLMSFGRGLTTQFRISFRGLGDNLVMLSGGQSSVVYQGLPKGRRLRLYAADIALLRETIPEIEFICTESYNNEAISANGKETNRNVHGVGPLFDVMRTQVPRAGGRFLNADDERYSRRVAFLGWKVAENLFAAGEAVGKTIMINRTPFTVVGVLKEKMQDSMYQGPDAEQVYVPFATYAQVNSQPYVDRIHIQPRSREVSLLVEERARSVLGRKYRFDPADKYALNVWNTIKGAAEVGKIFSGIEIFLTLIGALTLLIAAVGVTNLMYALAKERTREIGIKLAMGARRRHIVAQFVLETAFIFLKGTLWGVLLAFNIVSLVRTIPLNYDNFGIESYLTRPVFSFDILLVFLAIMGALVFLAGIFPAVRASRLNPVEALRYE